MGVFSKQKVNSAVTHHSKLDVSGTHITTANFMQIQPIFYRHMIPGEHLRGNIQALSRLAPVAVPTYGRCRLNLRSFFVPFTQVFPNFLDFLGDSVASNYSGSSLVSESPKFSVEELYLLFANYHHVGVYPLSVIETDITAPYDFEWSGTHHRFTQYGRRYYKILRSLGYQLVLATDKQSFFLSALPLLCYAKVFIDYYINHGYENIASVLNVKQLFKFNDPASVLNLGYGDIGDILALCCIVFYDDGHDVYTNAWDHPFAPNTGNFSSLRIDDIQQGGSSFVETNVNGTPIMKQSSSSGVDIGSLYIHDVLKAMTDYFKRNQLSGALAASRFLSRYGIKLNNDISGKSYYLNSLSMDIDFGSVMQTADTSAAGDPSNLGDYAGVGFGKGGLDVDFHAEMFGLFIVMLSIVPAGDLVQGIDRNNFHITKTQFFTNEYDQLGCDFINKAEVYVSKNSSYVSSYLDYITSPFGFAPRYYEYKQGRSFLTGDFTTSAFVGGDAWHLNRLFTDASFVGGISGQTHSYVFTSGFDAAQYDRIFQYTDTDIDKFYIVAHASLQAIAPCKSLFDSYDFENAGKTLTQNGNSAVVN